MRTMNRQTMSSTDIKTELDRRVRAEKWPGSGTLGAAVVVLLLFLTAASPAVGQRLDPGDFKTGKRVRGAFREVVAQAGQATVRVLCEGKQVALGTLVGSDGSVLTKASELAGVISCVLSDGSEVRARVVGEDRAFDLALLKVDAKQLTPVSWSANKELSIGQWLATPGLDELPLAVGVLSVTPRAIPPLKGVLGISIAETGDGAKVTRVVPNSGADRAGLRVGDLILSVAGRVVESRGVLEQFLGSLAPGDTLSLRIARGDEQLELEATLGQPFSRLIDRNHLQNRMGGQLSRRRAGFAIALQHDSVIRPQDCGGPLVDLTGRAVGINIARAGRTETYAIPAATVLNVLKDLKPGVGESVNARPTSRSERQ